MINYPETSLEFSLPEELGFLKNVIVHIQLEDGRNIPIVATHELRYHSTGKEWPIIFNKFSNEPISNWNITGGDEPNSSMFGIIYECYDKGYLNGSFYISFTGWKYDNSTDYYTETRTFSLEADDEDFGKEF